MDRRTRELTQEQVSGFCEGIAALGLVSTAQQLLETDAALRVKLEAAEQELATVGANARWWLNAETIKQQRAEISDLRAQLETAEQENKRYAQMVQVMRDTQHLDEELARVNPSHPLYDYAISRAQVTDKYLRVLEKQ